MKIEVSVKELKLLKEILVILREIEEEEIDDECEEEEHPNSPRMFF